MGASSYRLLDGANSNTTGGFLQRRPEANKKNAQEQWVLGGLSALAHEPVQTKSAGKLKQKPTPQLKTHAN
jgi:hypothetical protein